MRKLLILITSILLSNVVRAQIHPVANDTLHYRVIHFSVPPKSNITTYRLEVAETYIRDDGIEYSKNILEENTNKSSIIAIVPSFGMGYKWRVKYFRKNIVVDSTSYYSFYVLNLPSAENAKSRLRILNDSAGADDFYVFTDINRTLYDRKGNAIWFLPGIPGVVEENPRIRDLKITPFNTISFTTMTEACEIDYDGNVLWRAPNNGKVSGDSTEGYHHEFTRLHNGNYMVIGTKSIVREIPENASSSVEKRGVKIIDGKKTKKIQFGTLIEYDSRGNIIWSWVSGDHFTDEDLFTPTKDSSIKFDTHMNAFFFDEKTNSIYTSYRNISRVMKISYPSGKVIANYGHAYTPTQKIYGNGIFYGQHSCKISSDGELYLFNNNTRTADSTKTRASSVVFFREPVPENDKLVKTWEFFCDADTLFDTHTIAGGGVVELTNGNILVCTGKGHNFIVSKTQKMLWSAALEMLSPEGIWQVAKVGYRNSAIESRQALNKLILNVKK